MKKKIINVYLETTQYKLKNTFTYLISSEDFHNVEIGTTVEVPFNNQILTAFVIGKDCVDTTNYEYELKLINKIHDQQLSTVKIKTIQFLMDNYLVSFIDALNLVYPSKMRVIKKKKQKIITKSERLISVYERTEIPIFDNKLEILNPAFNEQKYYLKNELINYASVLTNYQIDKAVKKGYIQKVEILQSEYKRANRIENDKVLTVQQLSALSEIKKSNHHSFLLFGEMGSGKTEIFIKLIEQLESEKQVLIIEPNNLLKEQIWERLNAVYPEQVLNLDLNANHDKVFNDNLGIKNGQYKIVIAHHHGLFADWNELGYVIIDEAHDFNYLNKYPQYDLFDVLRFYQKLVNFKVICATATPKVDMYARSTKGFYQLINLPAPYYQQNVEIVFDQLIDYDLPISVNSLMAIKKELENGNKVLVFHNKRGFASALECSSCYRVPKCPNCQKPLNYYQENTSKLRCHNCNFQVAFKNHCTRCNLPNTYKPIGVGIEKVKEHLTKYFKDYPLHTIDSTTTKTNRKNILRQFTEKKPQILLGTQMITLGIDIPDVTLAIATNIDDSLINQSVEARESTMQLLTQFKGRIGRRSETAKLIIQTKYQEDGLFKQLVASDYPSYLKKDLESRYLLRSYPYVNYAKLTIMNENMNQLNNQISRIIKQLPVELQKTVELIELKYKMRIKTDFYFQKQIIIKYKREDISAIIRAILEQEHIDLSMIHFNPKYKR